jgi:hypothetical protein
MTTSLHSSSSATLQSKTYFSTLAASLHKQTPVFPSTVNYISGDGKEESQLDVTIIFY